jgi:hypothetical protein
MSSAGLCAAFGVCRWWGGGRGRTLRITRARLEAGEPAEQLGVLIPFGQVGGDDVGVDGFECFAFGLGGGALWRRQISQLSECLPSVVLNVGNDVGGCRGVVVC